MTKELNRTDCGFKSNQGEASLILSDYSQV